MANSKDYLNTHSLLHTAFGLGLGFLLVALVPGLSSIALLLGIIFVLLGFGGELVAKK